MTFQELIEAVDVASYGRVGGAYDARTLEEIKDLGTPFDEIGHFIFNALLEAGCDQRVDRHNLQRASQTIHSGIISLRAVDEFICALQESLSTSNAQE